MRSHLKSMIKYIKYYYIRLYLLQVSQHILKSKLLIKLNSLFISQR